MTSSGDQPEQRNHTAADRSPAELAPLSAESGMCGGPGQISCGEANELIQTYLDARAVPASGDPFAEHLGDCPPCESEFVVYQRIVESLGRCRPDLPVETKDRLQRFCTDLARRGAATDLRD